MTSVDQLKETDYQEFVESLGRKKSAEYYGTPMDQVAQAFRTWYNETHKKKKLDELNESNIGIVMRNLRGRFRGEDSVGQGKPDEKRKNGVKSTSQLYGGHKKNPELE